MGSVAADSAQAKSAASAAQSTARTLIIIVALIAVLLCAVMAVLLSRHIKRHVARILDRLEIIKTKGADRLKEGLQALAEGDLTRNYPITTKPETDFAGDELGRIQREVEDVRERLVACFHAYNDSAENLRAMIGTVSSTAATVGAASQQMSCTSDESGKATAEIAQAVGHVAEGAERQVKMIDEARRSADHVCDAVAESARTAHASAELAHDTRQVAHDGVSAAERAVEAMQSVQASSMSVTDAITDLAGKSEQIGQIVQSITGIAEQTNLLALNAAIEAARAGEQGRVRVRAVPCIATSEAEPWFSPYWGLGVVRRRARLADRVRPMLGGSGSPTRGFRWADRCGAGRPLGLALSLALGALGSTLR